MKIGYKASYKGKCRNITFEVGKTYTYHGNIELCTSGFHYCTCIDDIFTYYLFNSDIVIFEIHDLSDNTILGNNKSVTDKIKIARIIDPREYNTLFNLYIFNNKHLLIHQLPSQHTYHVHTWYEYDSNNNLILVEDGDITKQFEYNSANLLIKETRSYKHENTSFWVETEYNSDNKILSVLTSKNWWKKYTYDSDKNLVNIKHPYNSRIGGITLSNTNFTYDCMNRVLTEQNCLDDESRYGYFHTYKYNPDSSIVTLTKKDSPSDVFSTTHILNYDINNNLIGETIFNTDRDISKWHITSE